MHIRVKPYFIFIFNFCFAFPSVSIGILAGNYIFKVNNRNTRTRCEICSKLTIKTPERCQWPRSGVFIVNFEHISHIVLVFFSSDHSLTRFISHCADNFLSSEHKDVRMEAVRTCSCLLNPTLHVSLFCQFFFSFMLVRLSIAAERILLF